MKRKITKKIKNPSKINNEIIYNFINFIKDKKEYKENKFYYDHCIDNITYIMQNSQILKRLGAGSFGIVFKLQIIKRLFVKNMFIAPGIYAIKLYFTPVTEKCFKILETCSAYGLVPEIYIQNKCFSLMKYIDGITLGDLRGAIAPQDYKNLWDNKVKKLIIIFDQLVSHHNRPFIDIYNNPNNYIVTHDLKKVYMIDPCS